jgi:hypothetical protein
MNYTMTSPCAKCPFRNDIPGYLTKARAREIVGCITQGDGTFACHETLDYDGEDGEGEETPTTQHCAGAMILLEKLNRPNQMMRICERLGMYDAGKLKMDAAVVDSPREFIRRQRTSR